jgi:glycosyltransferase involved in cell wall biosynthesis
MVKDLVSVIIPVYNSEKFVSHAIKSVISQRYNEIEILIGDDCSTDNSLKVINAFSSDIKVKIFRNPVNLGAGKTRNKLIKESSGKYICFLDSDDMIREDKIEKQVDHFQKNKNLALCGTFCQITDNSLNPVKVDIKNTSYADIKHNIISKNQFVGASIMIKKEVLEEIGGYRDFFSEIFNEDYDLTARIVEKYPCINIPEPLYIYRMNPKSLSHNSWTNPYKLHSHQLVSLFIKQREKNGSDWLDENNFEAIDNFIKEKHKPYIEDPSLIYREMAAVYNEYNNSWKATKISLNGILKKPSKLINYRTLGYSLKKMLRII